MKIKIPDQKNVLEHYSSDVQAIIHCEEMAELIQAVSKMHRVTCSLLAGADVDKNDAYCNLVEEMADVLICMEQIQEMYEISDQEIQKMIIRKCVRQEDRMREFDKKFFKR